MAKRITLFAFIFLGLGAAAPYSLGQGENSPDQPAPDAAAVAVAEEVTPVEIAEADAAGEDAVEEVFRDPFWPVGHVPSAPRGGGGAAAAADGSSGGSEGQGALDLAGLSPEEQQVIKQRMRVGGVLQQAGQIWAILNNQLVEQGETVKIDSGRKVYVFLVKELTSERIVLESQQDP